LERGRRIAFDYGQSRIGVAVCDPDGILATPLEFLEAKHPKLDRLLANLIAEYQPRTIYLGLPRQLSGVEGSSAEMVRSFAAELTKITDTPIVFIDERLSTVDAQAKLKAAGKNSKESKKLIDSMAAVTILERGLANES
jgi:putative Holliday junction resolvase